MQQPDYGMVRVQGIPWLVQGGAPLNLYGLDVGTPPRVRRGPARACPHNMNLDPQQIGPELPDDDLFRAMLPEPREGAVFFLPEAPVALLAQLLRLSSSTEDNRILPAWTLRKSDVTAELSTTNLAPLVISQLTLHTQHLVNHLAGLGGGYPRTVILTGESRVVTPLPIKRIKTWLTPELMQGLPLEDIGAWHLIDYARRG